MELKMVENLAAKVGHHCPDCGPPHQLYKADEGLRCPLCNTVFTRPSAEAGAPEAEEAAGTKGKGKKG